MPLPAERNLLLRGPAEPSARMAGSRGDLAREPSLEPAWAAAIAGKNKRSLLPFELCQPRRYFVAATTDFDPIETTTTSGKADVRQKVREGALRGKVATTLDEMKGLEWPEEPAPRLGVVWLTLPKTKGLESRSRMLPTIVKAWNGRGAPKTTDVAWQARQAAAVAAYHGLPEACVVAISPENTVYAFRVSLRHLGVARDAVLKAVHALRSAIAKKDPTELAICPTFTRESCPISPCPCVPAVAVNPKLVQPI